MDRKLGFIGCGNMAQALIRAFISSKAVKPGQIAARDKNDRKEFAKETGISLCSTSQEVISKSDFIFICVKPQDIEAVIEELRTAPKEKVFISIAAGVPTKRFTDKLKGIKIVRLMPSMNCQVNEMVSAVYFYQNIDSKERHDILAMLNSVGKAFELSEDKFDEFTALSCSVAFYAYLISLFSKEAEKHGIKNPLEIMNGYCLGTAKLMKEISPEELIKKVMSPKGATEAGMDVLLASDLKKIIEDTIAASLKRTKELGKNG
jgi:pyrroline-5-carboxylate reductase